MKEEKIRRILLSSLVVLMSINSIKAQFDDCGLREATVYSRCMVVYTSIASEIAAILASKGYTEQSAVWARSAFDGGIIYNGRTYSHPLPCGMFGGISFTTRYQRKLIEAGCIKDPTKLNISVTRPNTSEYDASVSKARKKKIEEDYEKRKALIEKVCQEMEERKISEDDAIARITELNNRLENRDTQGEITKDLGNRRKPPSMPKEPEYLDAIQPKEPQNETAGRTEDKMKEKE